MVDIHCHILPGLDDGPDTLDEAVGMAEAAIADGITHVVATPHANDTYVFDPEQIRARCDELQARVGERLRLATGCDFHLSFENLEALRANPARFTINQKNYLLVEFADFSIPRSMDDALDAMLAAGLRPVITHPERNPLLCTHQGRLEGWVHKGCYVQVTALSLLGRFGSGARRAVERWLEADCVHFFASDAHNVTSRPLRLKQAYEKVARTRGKEAAKALFRDNPLAALEGRSLPHAAEPAPESEPRRKRFFFF